MSSNEILDQVDEEGKVIGQATRAEFHSNPDMIHPVVHCWLFNSKGEILWQQRSMMKDSSPGRWDMSCGGHIRAGDTPEDTLHRELEEELGLEKIELRLAEKYIYGNDDQTELVYLYYAFTDKLFSEFVLQEEEVEQVEWIAPHVAQKMVLDGERDATEFIFSQVTRILEILAFKK